VIRAGPVLALIPLGAAALLVAACALPEMNPDRYAAPRPGVAWQPPPEDTEPLSDAPESAGIPAALAEQADRLSLDQLVDAALESNPSTRQKWEQARAAAAAWAAARGEYYPSLDGYVVGAHYDVGRSVGTSSFEGPQAIERLRLSYLLFDFGGRRARTEAARQVLLAANWNHDEALQDVVRNVGQAFYAYLGAKAQLEADESSLAETQTSLRAAQAQRETGEGTLVDVLTAQAQYQQARASVASDQGTVKTTRGNLATAVGWPANTEFDVQERLDEIPFDALGEDVDAFIERARRQRPDLAAVRASVRQMEAELRQARAGRWPEIKLAAAVGGEQLGGDLERSNFDHKARIEVKVPLFDGFAIYNQIREARANLEASRAALLIQEEAVISDVWNAYYEFHSSGAELEASKAALASAAESFEASLERYRDGAADVVELVQAQASLAGSRASVVQARTDLYSAYSDLVYAIGEEPVQQGH
jgi:outer membrane protein TolC